MDYIAENSGRQIKIGLDLTVGYLGYTRMTEVLNRYLEYNRFITIEAFVLPEIWKILSEVEGTIDYIVDAIDTVAAKLALAEYAKEHGIPLIASMGTGNKLHPELFQIADISETSVCPLCRVMRRELKKRGIERLKVLYSRETPIKPREQTEKSSESGLEEPEKIEGTAPRKRAVPGSVSFVPPAAGMMLAGCVIRSLAGIDDNL